MVREAGARGLRAPRHIVIDGRDALSDTPSEEQLIEVIDQASLEPSPAHC
jgi:hypothetical protein